MNSKIFQRNVIVVLPLLIALSLGLYNLDNKSLWLDEILTLRIAANWRFMWATLTSTEPYRWLYYVLLHIWMRFGSGDYYYRLLSVVLGLIGLPGIYLLGRKLFSERVGILSAYTLAFHPMYIRYLQEVHSYSLLLSLSIWSTYCLVLFMESPVLFRTITYGFSAILLVYSHHFGLLVVMAHFFVLFMNRRFPVRLSLGAFVLVSVGILPMMIHFIPWGNISWIQKPELRDIFIFLIQISGGHVLITAIVGYLLYRAWRISLHGIKKDSREKKSFRLIWICFLFPIVSAILVSVIYRPVLVNRYLIITVPPLILLVSRAALGLKKQFRAALGICASILLILNIFYWFSGSPIYQKLKFIPFTDQEEWKSATQYVTSHWEKDDVIVFYNYYTRYPFDYYVKNRQNSANTPVVSELSSQPYTIGGVMPEPDWDLIKYFELRHKRVWLVLSHNSNVLSGSRMQTQRLEQVLNGPYPDKTEVSFTGINILIYNYAR